MVNMFFGNLETLTKENTDYRKILYTDDQMQLVLMCLNVGETVPFEVHKSTTQFVRVESGECVITFDGTEYVLKDGQFIIIPPGTNHEIRTIGTEPVKLYTIYAPKEHVIEDNSKRQPNEHNMNNSLRRYKRNRRMFDVLINIMFNKV
jgi:mannose-6-phosphate isomerase-like protein (cupin superfamily)